MRKVLLLSVIALVWLMVPTAGVGADNTDAVFARMALGNLEALQEQVAQFRQTLAPVDMPCAYQDLRAVIHCHSHLSHDSHGTLEEQVAAAKATGTRVIMLTDHRNPEHDVLTEGFSGFHDGVLFFPGAEARNLLIYSPQTLDIGAPPTLQALIDEVAAKGGMTFLSHVEEVEDFGMTGLTGMEIYNLHAQAKEAPGLLRVLTPRDARDQARLMTLVEAIHQYPHLAVAALSFRPDTYLRAFDEVSQRYCVTGIAAPDSHSNTGIVIKAAAGGQAVIEDILGETIVTLPAAAVPFPGVVRPDAEPGEELFRLHLDPYDVSFGHVGTFLLAAELTPQEVLGALRAGRCYVAFDWIADPSGFRFAALRDGKAAALMGEEIALGDGLELVAAMPAEAVVHLYRNGEQAGEARGRTARWSISTPGVYRVEAYVELVDEPRPWILSNPIYVR